MNYCNQLNNWLEVIGKQFILISFMLGSLSPMFVFRSIFFYSPGSINT